MTYDQIKAALVQIKSTLEDKGYCRVATDITINADTESCLHISYHGADSGWESHKSEYFYDDSWDDVYSLWLDYLNTMPSKEETDRQAYYKALAKVVELGEALSLETPMINPLREIMERLASNALTHNPL